MLFLLNWRRGKNSMSPWWRNFSPVSFSLILSGLIENRETNFVPVNFSTRSSIETNQPCAKSLRKLLRSGSTKGNGTSSEPGRNGRNESATELQKVSSTVMNKQVEGKTSSSTVLTQNRDNKKRKRRKHKGRRRERNKEAKLKKEKHERRKAAGNYCVERINNE